MIYNLGECISCGYNICKIYNFDYFNMLSCRCYQNEIVTTELNGVVRYFALSSANVKVQAYRKNSNYNNNNNNNNNNTHLTTENYKSKLNVFFDIDLSKNFQEQVDAIATRLEKLIALK